MKRTLLGLTAILAAGALLLALPCPPTQIADPIGLDPNMVNYKLLCIVEAVAGETISHELTACDPDEDNQGFTMTLAGAPAGMVVGQDGGGWRLGWVAVEGIYYVDITLTDMPVGDIPRTDQGTIAFKVYRRNNPPVLGGCR